MTERYTKTQKGKTLLLILDGFGLVDPKQTGNAITPSTAPHIFGLMQTHGFCKLVAHGSAVGLPKDQEGNSEAGHLNIGAGRVVLQDIQMVSEAIANGTFFKNHAFLQAIAHVKKHQSRMHVMGLLTGEHSAHASPDHVEALLKLFKDQQVQEVYLHLFTDGRDSGPHSAAQYLYRLRKQMPDGVKVATVVGRRYAMDRGKNWERTAKAYKLLTDWRGLHCTHSAEEAIAQAYARGESDEYIAPTCIEGALPIGNDDAIVFFNARSDRARQLAKAFVQKEFTVHNPGAFHRGRVLKNLCFVAMSEFGPDLEAIHTAFPSPDIPNCLAHAIGSGHRQLFIAESEKFAHVTYFINGGYPQAINGEQRELVQSAKVHSYADAPAMKTRHIAEKIMQYFQQDKYDFICANFPNADMVGHTGNIAAAKEAVGVLDKEIARLAAFMRSIDGTLVVTADHGNAEEMIDPETGKVMTKHSKNPVPFFIVRGDQKYALRSGALSDVAPTILDLLGCPKPKAMTGRSLLV